MTTLTETRKPGDLIIHWESQEYCCESKVIKTQAASGVLTDLADVVGYPLILSGSDYKLAKSGDEANVVALIVDGPPIEDLVYTAATTAQDPETGRLGMTAEQVLRCAILKQYRNLTYEELAFHLVDSRSFRAFAKLDWGQKPGASTLQENINSVTEATWETINRVIIGYAAKQDLEKGRTIRMDSTAVESDIHHPTDSTLLQDGIRIITRLLIEGKGFSPTPGYTFSDHTRVVKKRVIQILNSKKEEERTKCYRELIEIALRVKTYGVNAIGVLES